MKLKWVAISLIFSVIQVFSHENPALEYFNAGVELMENHEFVEAIEPFSKAIDLNPANITFFYHRDYSFFKMLDYHSARSDFKVCVGVVPNDPNYNFFLGLSESKLGNFVEADGSISIVRILRSTDPLLDAEAIRLVKSSPAWEPGKQRGEPVRVIFNLAIPFRLNK